MGLSLGCTCLSLVVPSFWPRPSFGFGVLDYFLSIRFGIKKKS